MKSATLTAAYTGLLPVLLCAFGPFYVALCAALRYRRVRCETNKLGFTTYESLSRMTVTDAQYIIHYLAAFEFPLVSYYANAFALFKTYGIPSISKLLVATGQLASEETSSKRTADTAILIAEFVSNPPDSERAVTAIARMNYLHSRLVKAGKITNDDLLYTLCLFAHEPQAWVDDYEWRNLTDMEICALGTFWKSIGDAMNIDFSPFKPGQKPVWDNGLEWMKSAVAWSTKYEEEHMVPEDSNHVLGDATMHLLLWFVPSVFYKPARRLATSIFEQRLRKAMLFPEPSSFEKRFMFSAIWLRRMFVRYLSLPRPNFLKNEVQPAKAEEPDRFYAQTYLAHPWYMKPTLSIRWGASGLLTRLVGGTLPGDEGDKYVPQGMKTAEVGPQYQVGKGHDAMKESEQGIRQAHQGGCPFKH